jgi:uncharacterized protein (TIGR00645 family)
MQIESLLGSFMFAGNGSCVSRMTVAGQEDRPSWMGQVGFSRLKMKLIGSIVAISAIELPRAFMRTEQLTGEQIGWKLAVYMRLVISGLLFAIMDRIAEGTKQVEVSRPSEPPRAGDAP